MAYAERPRQGKLLTSLNFNPIKIDTVIAVVFLLCRFLLVQATYALVRGRGRSDAIGDRLRIPRLITCPASLN